MASPTAIGGALLPAAGQAGMVGGLYPPWTVWAERSSFSRWPNRIPSMPELVAMRFREEIGTVEYFQLAKQNGYAESYAQKFFLASQARLTPSDAAALLRRQRISVHTFAEILTSNGYPPEAHNLVLAATEYFPQVDDWIRFAVRDVFDAQAVAEGALFSDFPKQFAEAAEKLGLNIEHAKFFWGAHWVQPSITQAFEMLHRRVITPEQLRLLLKAQDIAPGWRDKLTKISYSPLTRVDIRRMFDVGELSQEEVSLAYQDIGYDVTTADRLMRFTVKLSQHENAGLTIGTLKTSYIKQYISKEELIGYLKQLKLSDNIIDYHVSIADAELKSKEVAEIIEELTAQFEQGLIDEDFIRDTLLKFDANKTLVNSTLAKLRLKISKRVKLPSRADYERWLEKDIISETDFFGGMSRLGYRASDIRLYLTEIKIDAEAPKVRYLKDERYAKWVAEGIMDTNEYEQVLRIQGRREVDIARLKREATQPKKQG